MSQTAQTIQTKFGKHIHIRTSTHKHKHTHTRFETKISFISKKTKKI